VKIGSTWPPVGIEALNPWEIPLLNTVLLLSSGATLTYSHHSLIAGSRKGAIFGLILTVVLAVIFTLLQIYEYYNSSFTISDGVYGSTFYFAAGFHKYQLLLGIFFLICLFRIIPYYVMDHHSFELGTVIHYWHE
jgi:cytochrome c oxidase subunit 3